MTTRKVVMGGKLPDANIITAGSVVHELPIGPVINAKPLFSEISLKYPSRLEAISIDESKIAEYTADNIYTAGQIDFCIAVYKTIKVSLRLDNEIKITDSSQRKPLILHSALLMKAALNTDYGFNIDVSADLDLRHCGLGSSSSIIHGVGAAINELFGNPIAPLDLVRYLVSNHGEEISIGDERIIQVQSVGGSGLCGHFEGGLIVNAGKCVPILRKKLPDTWKVVLGVPKNFTINDSESLMEQELENIDGFITAGKKYAKDISYRLVNEVLPDLIENRYKSCKDLIFDVRWDMDSNKNCSFVYPEIMEIAEKLRPLKADNDVKFVALSSVGPAFFIITGEPNKAKRIFDDLEMKSYLIDIHNGKYEVKERK
jgi:predicted sugar kinase